MWSRVGGSRKVGAARAGNRRSVGLALVGRGVRVGARWCARRACRRLRFVGRLALTTDQGHCRQGDHGQGCDFAFHGLLTVAVNRRDACWRGARPTSRFGIDVFMDCSIRKRMIKSGANRTFMLVVEAGASGLPFERAQPVVSCFVLCAFIYCPGLQHGAG